MIASARVIQGEVSTDVVAPSCIPTLCWYTLCYNITYPVDGYLKMQERTSNK